MDKVIKILFVTNTLPYPVSKNGNTENVFNLMCNLKEDASFQVDMIFLGNIHQTCGIYFEAVRNVVHKLFTLNLQKQNLIRFSYFLFRKNLGLTETYDIIFFNSFLSGYCRFNFYIKQKTLLYQADSRSLFYSGRDGIKNKIKYYKSKLEQKFLFRYFNRIIFVSELDEYEVNCYAKLSNKTCVIPIGVNLPNIDLGFPKNKKFDLIFTGNFHFGPNADGSVKFLKEVCPNLISLIPDIKICFAGRFPTSQMIQTASLYKSNVIITGEVVSLSDYLFSSKIYISPVYWGAGMKNKILQAMAHKLPIVCTVESTAGIKEKAMFNVVKTTHEWLVTINHLLNEENLCTVQGQNNYDTIIRNYLFKDIARNHFIPLIKSMI